MILEEEEDRFTSLVNAGMGRYWLWQIENIIKLYKT
jgi:hypothetical protein